MSKLEIKATDPGSKQVRLDSPPPMSANFAAGLVIGTLSCDRRVNRGEPPGVGYDALIKAVR